MSAGVVIQQMITIFLLVITGYILYKKKLVNDATSPGLSAIVINICGPALLLHSSLEKDPSITNEKMILSLAAGAIIYAALLIVSVVIPEVLGIEKKWKKHYAMMCIFGNTGYIGIPLIIAVLGEKALMYTVVVNAYYNLIFYSYGYYLAGGEGKGFELRKLINMGNISLVLAVLFFLLEPPLPYCVNQALGYMGNATVLLAMIVIGINLARSDLKSIFAQKKMYLFIAVRFVLIPILLAFLLRLFIHDELMIGVMVILAAVPVGNLPLMRVEETGGDGTVLAQGIILSTVLAVVTIPVVTLFL